MQVDQPMRAEEQSEWAVTVVDGPSAGTRLAWRGAEVVLGRTAGGSALFGNDPAVSRRHAVIRRGADGTCVVEDLNSTNGTLVNGEPIDRPTVLGPEDELRIGNTGLRLAPAPAGEEGADGEDAGARYKKQARARKAGRLTLSVLAAIAGTILASAMSGSPQLRLAAAAVGSAVPAFVTEPGRYQRQRAMAAALLMAAALFVTYGGATLFSYATRHTAIYPLPPAAPPPAPAATPRSTPTPTGGPGTPTVMPTIPVSPTVTPTIPVSPTVTPTIPVSPTMTPAFTVSPTPSAMPSSITLTPTAPSSPPAP
jgi:hypothetical protein